ncbi:LacI family DNA-binding transcriptional regulator [Psychromonas sp. KJ10-2]|uniref:LacI family DNA-binding transcriptional regulator n=1 Tax=Psychromonas sp. KJ10-2 TaxID=3391822 RepID=UPI0039B654AB
MATIKDVAKHAQVSTSTVSHVLNKTRHVSDEVTEKVKAAVELLNYAPSALARSLKLKNTRTFGMLVTTSINPFFAEVVKGLSVVVMSKVTTYFCVILKGI